jgi:DNA modification methylase
MDGVDLSGMALNVELLSTAALRPYAGNSRTHSPKQIGQIAESMRRFGFTNPILIDANRIVIAGHARLEAAKLLGIRQVPTIRLDRMTEAEKRAYIIADNKLAENAGWDRELLALELKYISELDVELDLSVTGFEPAEIDLSLQGLESEAPADQADEVFEPDRSGRSVTRVGDLWRFADRHFLLCGDARRRDSFSRLLLAHKARLVVTDPPYNLRIDGVVCGSGAIKHREFLMSSGEMSEAEFTAFLKTVLHNLASFSTDGSIHFVFMDWRHLFELLSAGREIYTELKNLCVWNKTNGGQGSLYRSKHELILVFKNGTRPHINNVELGRFGRSRTNVWDYPGVNTMRAGRLEELAMHPTVKPLLMISDAILDCSKRGDIVLDCFGGSGTTLLAAERTGRKGFLMEVDPAYVDVAIRRFEKLTGIQAVHAETGLSFDEIRRRRTNNSSSEDRRAQRQGRKPATVATRSKRQSDSASQPRKLVASATAPLGSNGPLGRAPKHRRLNESRSRRNDGDQA